MKIVNLYYESPQDVPAPYHFESKIGIQLEGKERGSIEVEVQYIDRDDFSKDDLLAEGLQVDNHWNWKGRLPEIWLEILSLRLKDYLKGEASPKAHEPFVGLEDEVGHFFKPKNKLDVEDVFIQEFMQAILELSEKELPLYLGFQFNHLKKGWILVEGEMSFSQRKFNYITNGNEAQIEQIKFESIQELMNELYIGEFVSEKALEKLKNRESFAVFPGDGLWYIAGNSWRKPNGNHQYFASLELSLNQLFG